MRIRLKNVPFMPEELESDVLYVATKFGAAAHLCACGCGTKVRTPLGPTDWSLKITKGKATLYPSIENWQRPCRSHYWIRNGNIVWAEKLTATESYASRQREIGRNRDYYSRFETENRSITRRFITQIRRLFRRY
jgi:hypothetical protein